MIKIMVVCTGNICRSPMAEGYLAKRLKDENIEAEVLSCGVYAEGGDNATPEAIEAIGEYNVDIGKHKSTYVLNSKIQDMDIILCATTKHKNKVTEMFPHLVERIYTLKEYAYGREFKDLELNDPWGYGIEVYRKCASQIVQAVEEIIKKLKRSIDI